MTMIGLRSLRRFSTGSLHSPTIPDVVATDKNEEYFRDLLRQVSSFPLPSRPPLFQTDSDAEAVSKKQLPQKALFYKRKQEKRKLVADAKPAAQFASDSSGARKESLLESTIFKPVMSDVAPLPSSCDSTPPPVGSPEQPISDSLLALREWFTNLDLNSLSPSLRPSGNLAAYVPRSHTLSKLVLLGVDLSKIEAIPGVANMLVKLDFETAVEPLIWKLSGYGFAVKAIARLLTGYPKILQLPSDELDKRMNYFSNHGFKQPVVVEMIVRYPSLLKLTVVEVDRQLGSVQSLFKLSADELRGCISSVPNIILHPISKIKDVYVILTKMMGFSTLVTQSMVCSHPKLLITENDRLSANFMFMHSRLDLPIESIQMWPSALTAAPHLLPQRATFLLRRGLLQLDPKRPLYTPLSRVVEGSDAQFCQTFGHVDEQKYNTYLKTL